MSGVRRVMLLNGNEMMIAVFGEGWIVVAVRPFKGWKCQRYVWLDLSRPVKWTLGLSGSVVAAREGTVTVALTV